ncbi:MAG: GtrA family protein [Hyphomicrobiaceae bacterium]
MTQAPAIPQRWRVPVWLVIAGSVALLVDLAVLNALMAFGLSAGFARLFAVTLAMIVSWIINRTYTFPVGVPPTLREFLSFAGVSWVSQAVNYTTFLVLLALVPGLSPTLAVLGACGVAVLVAVAGFKYVVFRKAGQSTEAR